MPSNRAAFSEAPKAHPLVIKDAPYTSAQAGELVIRNAAVAINPADWALQRFAFAPMQYPNVFGNDVAGVVEEVGEGVQEFQKGDRVIAISGQLLTGKPATGAFQNYTVVKASCTLPLPNNMTFSQGVVLPLATATAAHALFDSSRLGLTLPSINPTPRDEVVLVWGGAGSVGMSAIQLLKNAGYTIITAASPDNFDTLHNLVGGEKHITVVDYTKPTAVMDIISSIQRSGQKLVGAFDCVSSPGPDGTVRKCISVLRETSTTTINSERQHRIVATVKPGTESESVEDQNIYVRSLFATKNWENEAASKAYKLVGELLLPRGLMLAKPNAMVLGHGLESVQGAMDALMGGKVRGRKAVVTLADLEM